MVRHGKAAPLETEAAGPLLGLWQGHWRQAQGVGRRLRVGVGEYGQHEGLGVPEGVAVVAGTGQALGRDGPVLGSGPRLQHMEQSEPHRLLDFGVALGLHVGAGPELVEEGPLLVEQPSQRSGGRR